MADTWRCVPFCELPAGRRPRAVVAINDPAAYGAMRAITDRGLAVPEDIAVVGFSDDLRASLMPVPLTTIRQPAYELGCAAAERLIAAIDGEKGPENDHIVRAELVVRSSCGCMPRGANTHTWRRDHESRHRDRCSDGARSKPGANGSNARSGSRSPTASRSSLPSLTAFWSRRPGCCVP